LSGDLSLSVDVASQISTQDLDVDLQASEPPRVSTQPLFSENGNFSNLVPHEPLHRPETLPEHGAVMEIESDLQCVFADRDQTLIADISMQFCNNIDQYWWLSQKSDILTGSNSHNSSIATAIFPGLVTSQEIVHGHLPPSPPFHSDPVADSSSPIFSLGVKTIKTSRYLTLTMA
jgi:hypothetical protein